MPTSLREGQQAPDFTVPDADGRPVSLKEFRGRPVALFFFPRAGTPGWIVEAHEFRDALPQFQQAGAVIIGASTDTPPAQRRFRDKERIPFTLLCDTAKTLVQAYDVYREKNMYGRKVLGVERTTFLINRQGVIARVWAKVKPAGHAAEVLEALKGPWEPGGQPAPAQTAGSPHWR